MPDQDPFAGGGQPVDAGESPAAGGAANDIEIDDGELSVVGELREGETIDIELPWGQVLQVVPPFAFDPRRGIGGEGGMTPQDGIGLFTGDEDGFLQVRLFPETGIAGEVDLLRELVEDIEGEGFFQGVFEPFVIAVFQEATGVGAGYEVVVFERAGDDGGDNGVEKFLRGGEGGAGR